MTITKTIQKGEIVYSNFDHEYNMKENEVKESGKFHQHAAWDFCGYVWYNLLDKQFKEEIWISNTHRHTLSAVSLFELINEANIIYGDK